MVHLENKYSGSFGTVLNARNGYFCVRLHDSPGEQQVFVRESAMTLAGNGDSLEPDPVGEIDQPAKRKRLEGPAKTSAKNNAKAAKSDPSDGVERGDAAEPKTKPAVAGREVEPGVIEVEIEVITCDGCGARCSNVEVHVADGVDLCNPCRVEAQAAMAKAKAEAEAEAKRTAVCRGTWARVTLNGF
jgi:hypothetical protein